MRNGCAFAGCPLGCAHICLRSARGNADLVLNPTQKGSMGKMPLGFKKRLANLDYRTSTLPADPVRLTAQKLFN